MSDLYVSIDIESTGPAPGMYSMLSLGAAAFTDGKMVGEWHCNLEELGGAGWHPDTVKFWDEHPAELAATRIATWAPGPAMENFVDWLETLSPSLGTPTKKPIAAAWPAAFDFGFVNWYLWRFVGRNPLGFSCVDMRSLAQGLTYSRGYYKLRENQIKALQKEVDRTGLVEHNALDDAIEQGRLHQAMLNMTKGGLPGKRVSPLDLHDDGIPL